MSAVCYLPDTNLLSNVKRHPQGPVAQRLLQVPADGAGTSIVVAAELRFGAERKGLAVLTQRVNQLLQQLPVWPLEPAMRTGTTRCCAPMWKAWASPSAATTC
jgi:tRNA(fMet)-specific endonuclease VapC